MPRNNRRKGGAGKVHSNSRPIGESVRLFLGKGISLGYLERMAKQNPLRCEFGFRVLEPIVARRLEVHGIDRFRDTWAAFLDLHARGPGGANGHD